MYSLREPSVATIGCSRNELRWMLVNQLQRQAGLAGAVGDRGNTTVIFVVPSIESNLLYAGLKRTLPHHLADQLGRITVPSVGQFFPQFRFAGTGSHQRSPGGVVDDLTTEVFVAAKQAQSGPVWRPTYFFPHVMPPSKTLFGQKSILVHDRDSPT
jgi:hypothetical protein